MNKQWLKLKMRRHIEARLSYIGLKDPTAVPPIDDDDIVELQDVHGNRIRVTRANAERSQTLRNLIEDAGTDNPIPLPNVRGRALWNLETILNLPPGQEYDGTRLSDDALLDLLVAANFLDLEDLISQLLPVWTSRSEIFPKFSFLTRPNDLLDPRSSLKALIPKALYFVKISERNSTIFEKLFKEMPEIPETVKYLFSSAARYAEPEWALELAAKNGERAVVNQLLKNPNLNPNQAFLKAVLHGHFEVVQRLLQDDRVDPTISSNAALNYAADGRHPKDLAIINLLLDDSRVNPAESWVFQVACLNNQLNIIERLLQDPRIDPGAKGQFAILKASEKGNLALVERLLKDSRVDPSGRSKNNSPLLSAARAKHYAVVERLLQDERTRVEELGQFSDPYIRQLYYDAMKNRSAKTRLEAPLCISCRVPGKAVMACGQCMEAFYCGYECQRADWTRHAAHCATKK